MLARIRGRLLSAHDERILIDVGPLALEALVPACDLMMLEQAIGTTIERFTLLLLEGAGVGSTLTPRLLAFATARDRAFFETFTTVKNIGHRKAMRALTRPIAEVAAAIAARDVATLTTLPGIGKRAAETIVAELDGKVDAFLDQAVTAVVTDPRTKALIEDTLAMLLALGEQRTTAVAMIDRARGMQPDAETPEDLLGAVYRLRETAS